MATATLAGAADDDAFERACRLLIAELDAVPLSEQPSRGIKRCQLTTAFKAALIAQVHRSVHVHGLTDAFRVVDAAYPDLTVNGQCTEAAVLAACGPLYGGLDQFRPATQTMLRAEARSLLTNALAEVLESRTVRP
ncbi:hypothetical protein DMH01_14615 [Amycolatopsis sp. WAC 04182]|uniref:hypothetical protein n=1 Tax=Amycolatopsis sp. WAC 04182 TaxID=2203198 RepID=UPI000F7B55F6|nr:hypothetical protein [Amycolatopsis sp. WAC 04182]RSN60536.1 hypothetical protein DMH01_14615 [Amycolatopsis sp. WAC 04182]